MPGVLKPKVRSAGSPTRWRARLWWLDIVYPLVLGALLFSALTYVVYTGKRQWRLSLQGERRLIEASLTLAAGAPPSGRRDVLVVNATPVELGRVSRAPRGQNPDASAEAYAGVVDRLASGGIPVIVVRWDPDAHPTDFGYYASLISVLKKHKSTTKIYLATSAAAFAGFPESLKEVAIQAVDDACEDPEQIQSVCPYLPDYKDWAIQAALADLSGEGAAPSGSRLTEPLPARRPVEEWVSSDLLYTVPSYILNLSAPDSIPYTTFGALLEVPQAPLAPPLAGYRIAFVGADQAGAVSASGDSSVVRRVRTVYDPEGIDISVAGTALHVFWAQIAQMYVDGTVVRIPTLPTILGTAAAFALAILLLMWWVGGPFALGFFLLAAFTAPWANAQAIRHGAFYLPVFDCYYFGLSSFIIGGFGKLSITAFQRWRLEAVRRLHAQVADLKGNFISLLSHNLNTPVAKMQGMLALLAHQAPVDSSWRKEVAVGEAYVAQLEYCIRAVLITAAIDEGGLHPTSRAVDALAKEFQASVTPSLGRLRLKVTVETPTVSDDELRYLPLAFDIRSLNAALGSLAALFHAADETTPVVLSLNVSQDERPGSDSPLLTAVVTAPTRQLPDAAAELLARFGTETASARQVRELSGPSFLVDVLGGMVLAFARAYHGQVVVTGAGATDPATGRPRGTAVTLTLRPS
jgi:signal transduction histidine kinase